MSQDQIPEALQAVTDQPIVEARFFLSEMAWSPYNQSQDWGTAKMVKIVMNAAKHGTFGKASPNGQLTMQIANPGAGTLFKLKGTDNSAGTFPIIVTNLAGTQGFVMDNSMKSYFGGLKTTIDATGAVVINGANTSGGTFPFTVYNSSSALLLGVGNDGTTHFAGNSSNVDGGGSFNGVQFAFVSGGPTITTGNGAPSATQPNGSIYLRKDGAANTRLYVSEGGGAWSAILSS